MVARIDRLFAKPAAVLLLFVVSLLMGWQGFNLGLDAISGLRPRLVVSVNLRTTRSFITTRTSATSSADSSARSSILSRFC
jgi:hypothetical protein